MARETKARPLRHAGCSRLEVNAEVKSHDSLASPQLADGGFEILNGVLPDAECKALADDLTRLHQQLRETVGGKLGGLRNLIRLHPPVAKLASSSAIMEILGTRSGGGVFPVRALFFDKTPAANWGVAWHQDLSIAVAGKIVTDGFTGWSVKEGVTHVQPPREILEGMITLRLHLDDCNAGNGALKVISGSHRHGKLDATEIARWTRDCPPTTCEVSRGGALLMRPLILHSSSPAQNPSHRRVLHIEYATDSLPNGLTWFDS